MWASKLWAEFKKCNGFFRAITLQNTAESNTFPSILLLSVYYPSIYEIIRMKCKCCKNAFKLDIVVIMSKS